MSKRLYIIIIVASVLALISIITIITIQLQVQKVAPTHLDPRLKPSSLPVNLRLPRTVIPKDYVIYLQPYLQTTPNISNYTSIFRGNATVKLTCLDATQMIYLHSKGLKLISLHLTHENGSDAVVEAFRLRDDETNFLEVELAEPLSVNTTYYLSTAFEGRLDHDFVGFYLDQYTINGSQRFLAASQLQPTDARKVFPCFDEPAMKAVFYITIIHRKNTVALSNTAQKEQTEINIDGEPWLITEFYPTLKMSTYLLGFVVFDFECKTTQFERYTIKTWARPDAVAAGHVDYAHNIAGSILHYFEDRYDIRYPLSKLDQVALPETMASGMENWGLITYHHTSLLYEEGASIVAEKEVIAEIVAHELAHQWFGNLVTMKWWNDLWLNEGFATYVSSQAVDQAEPSWNYKDLITKEVRSLLQMEYEDDFQPIISKEEDVESPSNISDQFNVITYLKGATVLRMLSAYLSEPVFDIGVKSYLNEYQYANAEHKDLWSHLQQAANGTDSTVQVANMMESWTQLTGYPLITINTTSGEIRQEHFFFNESSVKNTIWHVPIKVMRFGSQEIKQDLLTVQGPASNPAYQSKNDGWVLANVNCTGYYRVNYDPENWERLIQQLESNHQVIPVTNRGQLIDDAFNLAWAKRLNVSLALSTTRYLCKDAEFIPWDTAMTNLLYCLVLLNHSNDTAYIRAYLKKQIAPVYDHFEAFTVNLSVPETLPDQYSQMNALWVACSYGLPKCVKVASDVFKLWKQEPMLQIHPNLKQHMYCNIIASGGEEAWHFLWHKFQNTTDHSEKQFLRKALGCSRNTGVLKRYFEYALDPEKISKNESLSTIMGITKNSAGQAVVWDFIRSNWTLLREEHEMEEDGLAAMIGEATKHFSSEMELKQLTQFLDEQGEEGLGSNLWVVEHAIRNTEKNIEWVKENKHSILEWFRREAVAY